MAFLHIFFFNKTLNPLFSSQLMLTWNFFFYSKERSFACLSKKNFQRIGVWILEWGPFEIQTYFFNFLFCCTHIKKKLMFVLFKVYSTQFYKLTNFFLMLIIFFKTYSSNNFLSQYNICLIFGFFLLVKFCVIKIFIIKFYF